MPTKPMKPSPPATKPAAIVKVGIKEVLSGISARVAGGDLVKVSSALEELYVLEDAIARVKELARERLLQRVIKEGETFNENGSKKLVLGEMEVEARAVGGNTYDDGKVQRLLTDKGQLSTAGMDATVVYKTNPTKLASCGFTEKEIQSCLKERKFVLQRPRPVRSPGGIENS